MKFFPARTITETLDFKLGEVAEILQRERFSVPAYYYEMRQEMDGDHIRCIFGIKRDDIFMKNTWAPVFELRLSDDSGKTKVTAEFSLNKSGKIGMGIFFCFAVLFLLFFLVTIGMDFSTESILPVLIFPLVIAAAFVIFHLAFRAGTARLWKDIEWVLKEKYNKHIDM